MHQTEVIPPAPAGPGPVVVFLDFDGVTHPWGESEDFRCLPVFEAVLRDYLADQLRDEPLLPGVDPLDAGDWLARMGLSVKKPKSASRFSKSRKVSNRRNAAPMSLTPCLTASSFASWKNTRHCWLIKRAESLDRREMKFCRLMWIFCGMDNIGRVALLRGCRL